MALENQIDDLRRDRDGWRQQAEASRRLLTDARKSAWWTWLRKI
jgi:hypothetical protein